jgi:phosphatidylglycerophosphatase C
MTDPVIVAAFDVDRTLTTRDCVVPFLGRFAVRPAVLVRALARGPRAGFGVVRGDRDRLREAATAAVFRGVPYECVLDEAREFGELVVSERLRPDTVARLRWHAERGHRTVLVSASYDVYLAHIAAHVGADDVLATRLEVDAHGLCTGRLSGPNCRGAEKARRLRCWMDEHGWRRDEVDVWAYGDSAGDREMLAFADYPVWASEPLASVAPTA